MAEIIGSAVVQETVSQILTGLVHKSECKSNANESMERLEMAHIKLEAALEISNKWLITDSSLLRWRKKLKRAAQDCDITLHKCKQRILAEERMEQEVRDASFPKRIAHATKSFFSAFRCNNNNDSDGSIVRRFEWFADGATEFLRFVEVGGTPRRHMSFDSFVTHLFAGKELHHKIVRGNEHPSFLLWLVPYRTAEHGIEATLKIICKYENAPEKNFFLGVMLQISEHTDIFGIIMKCLQLFPPHFHSTIEIIRQELIELPTQDFSWMPCVDLFHWDNLHCFSTQWFRPDPLCCKQHDQNKLEHTSNLSMEGLGDASLEPIIEVSLQCQVPCSEHNKPKASLSECKNSLNDSPYLQVGLLYTLHGSPEDMLPVYRSSAVDGVSGKEQHCLHTDITLEELKETMLPKAIDYFHKYMETSVYQMLWRSKHGTAYIQVEKVSMDTPGARTNYRERRLVQLQDPELGSPTHMVAHFLNSWVAHAPAHLRGLILSWIRREMERQSAAQRYNYN